MSKEYKNLKDKAYHIIKEKIINCKIEPGSFINEKDLLEEIGASRTPVREALNILESEHLVKIYAKRGIQVTDITIKDVINIYTIREVLEPLATRLATPNISQKALNKYYKLFQDEMNLKIEESFSIDRDFHELIVKSTNNNYLSDYLMRIYDLNNRISILSNVKVKNRREKDRLEHMQLISYFLERDADKAEKFMKQHMINGRNAALQLINSGFGYPNI